MSPNRRPLKRVAAVSVSNVDKKTSAGEIPVRLINYTDVYHGDSLTPDLDLMLATATPGQVDAFRLQAGDVVITKDSETADDIGVAAFVSRAALDIVCGYHLAVLRPRPDLIDGRYLYWSMTGNDVRGQLSTGATGVTRYGLRQDVISATRVVVPPLGEQRAIADYLDTETARIDVLITKKRRLIELIDEQTQAALLETIRDWREIRSRTLRQYGTHVLTGPFGTVLAASEYVDGGVPLVNPTHIKAGRILPEDGVTVPEHVANRISRHRLAVGDLVMGRKGDVGRAAIVTRREDGWICGSDSIAIRCGATLDPDYLAVTLLIDLYRQQLARNSTGAMVLNVNEGTLLVSRV